MSEEDKDRRIEELEQALLEIAAISCEENWVPDLFPTTLSIIYRTTQTVLPDNKKRRNNNG